MTGPWDAVVVGAGHNGLVAANLLVDRGWRVVVLEANDHPGGAVHSDRSLHPDFVTDWFSSFYPMAAASPVIGGLELGRWGLRWRHAPAVLAHVFPDGRSAVLHRDVEATAWSMERFAPGDGQAWIDMIARFEAVRDDLLPALLTPFPPVRSGARLARTLGAGDLLRFARFVVQPVRRFADETFAGEGAPMLLAGNALHSDLSPEAAGSAIYGWLLCVLGQTVGFPVPAGGSGALVDALVARLRAGGGELRLGAAVDSIEVSDGRATGVRTVDGDVTRTATVLADVGAPSLYRDLVGAEHLPPRLVADLDRFQWDVPTLKLNWALSGPIPWSDEDVRGAGTVHLGVDLDGLSRYATDLTTGRLPEHPFALVGQMTTSDPSRSPAGTESAWAYTHLPPDRDLTAAEVERQAGRVTAAIERHAPGFGERVLAVSIQSPADLEASDANLVRGAIAGGTAAVHQELFFRPVPGLGRADTPIDGLYLAGASAHPGGAVHGAPGANAARAAIHRRGPAGRLSRAAIDAAFRRLYR
ncbi:NAD(P)/FAD-dependent oxidoreductase [Jatrophihabitans endophyticus]|uniref:phytoene desaturase family protein n=1 Tax=Jatrophihabitans endophyticus TaxID=1206085 RepID=UPI001A0A3B89|nr:NAD(P)/FAD-dependent oxidoreductase [Jatrophihabitans endophyticus]MBE7187103.1 NAD(P)/FAD-dependent oxidoreductase [Jatrophihabitans endophyticus]